MGDSTTLSKIGPDAEFISAGDDVVVLDGTGGIEATGVLVDASEDTAEVRLATETINGVVVDVPPHSEWKKVPFDRLAHPDSPQAEATAMFGDEPKPVAGKDTPASDDIITQCAGGCGKWMVAQHPNSESYGECIHPETGEMVGFRATPEWVAAEAADMERGLSYCSACGPAPSTTDERRAELKRIALLREFCSVEEIRAA